MLPLHQFLLVAALSGAVFAFPSVASELEEYDALRAALVRSPAKKDRPLPKWVKAQEFEPRPHYWLELQRPVLAAPVPQTPPVTANDAPRP